MELADWIEDVSGSEWVWIVKRLSGNDTLANGSHQAGPYLPKRFVLDVFPSFKEGAPNPDANIPVDIDSHDDQRVIRVIWYNNRVVGTGTRDETRLTNWGGVSSPLLDPDSTGALCVFAFHIAANSDADHLRIWMARSIDEEERIQSITGEVEPGQFREITPRGVIDLTAGSGTGCELTREQIPENWLLTFPSGQEIVDYVVNRLGSITGAPDTKLLKRRDCEFQVFRSVEREIVIPLIGQGFDSVDEFLEVAGSVMNRRKSRTGRSLELHLKAVFDEAGLSYAHGQKSEGNKKPDFLFPSIHAYHDGNIDPERLRMLGVKTTLKDRWRQILNEADRVPQKHLFTLQEGVSLNQFKEMKDAGVSLVVPEPIQKSYEKSIRSDLLSLDQFIAETAQL